MTINVLEIDIRIYEDSEKKKSKQLKSIYKLYVVQICNKLIVFFVM